MSATTISRRCWSSAPAPSGGLFGSSPSPAPGGSLFGAPSPAPSSGGLFGSAPSSGGLFGSTPAPSSGGLFGSTPNPALVPGAFSFGAPSPAPSGGLFGSGPPATSGFGASSGGLFGQPPAPAPAQPQGGVVYGAPAAGPMISVLPPAGSVIPPAANDVLATQIAALEKQRQELSKMKAWSPPETSTAAPASLFEGSSRRSISSPGNSSISLFRSPPRSSAPMQPRGFKTSPKVLPKFSQSRNGPVMTPEIATSSSITRLVIKPSPKTRPKLRLVAGDKSSPTTRRDASAGSIGASQPAGTPRSDQPSTEARSVPDEAPRPPTTAGADYYNRITSPESKKESAVGSSAAKNNPPKLTKAGYYCTPTIDVLSKLPNEDLAAIPNFSIERPGFGKIEWEGAVDLRGADLDRNAEIEQSTVSMYMPDEEEGKKPAVGSKLNRTAIVTLYNVFPKIGDREINDAIKARFAKKVEKQTEKMGATFLSYDQSLGEWKMKVPHFSRYSLMPDDDDDDDDGKGGVREEDRSEVTVVEDVSRSEMEGKSAKRTADKPRRLRFSSPTATSTVAVSNSGPGIGLRGDAFVSMEGINSDGDIDREDDAAVVKEADDAYQSMLHQLAKMDADIEDPVNSSDDREFADEGYDDTVGEKTNVRHVIPTRDDMHHLCNSSFSITATAAAKVGVKQSSIDFGVRFGRSFGGTWSRNGTFVHFDNMPLRLVHTRPLCSKSFITDKAVRNNEALMKAHKECTEMSDDSDNKQGAATSAEGVFRQLPYVSEDDGNKLSSILHTYTDAIENSSDSGDAATSIDWQIFSLLSNLLPTILDRGSDNVARTNDQLVLSSVASWFVEVCSADVKNEIERFGQSGDKLKAVLAAITSGDVALASQTASEQGMHQLSVAIPSGKERCREVATMVRRWQQKQKKIDQSLLRVVHLLSGSVSMEEELYRKGRNSLDWKRRFLLFLKYAVDPTTSNLSAVVSQYSTSVTSNAAPAPFADFAGSAATPGHESTLYRLLRFGGDPIGSSLRETIDPHGYSASSHDFSLSFHLCSVISSIGCPRPLRDEEDSVLVDGYAMQLLQEGLWEWAVYLLLCVPSNGNRRSDDIRLHRARALIDQHYNSSEETSGTSGDMARKRDFLIEVGVPQEWFEESMALRSSYEGDVFNYLVHERQVAPQNAVEVVGRTIVPNVLFMPKEDAETYLTLMRALAVDDMSIASAVLRLLAAEEELEIIYTSGNVTGEKVSKLLTDCDVVERTVVSCQEEAKSSRGKSGLHVYPGWKVVPFEAFLSEAASKVREVRMRLNAIESGDSSHDMTSYVASLARSSRGWSGNMFTRSMSTSENVRFIT